MIAMITAFRRQPLVQVKRILVQSLWVGAISTVSLLGGVIPSLQTPSAGVSFSSTAYAQAVSDQEIEEYARSVLSIEPIRQQAYNRIKNKIGYVPEIACHRPSSLNDLDSSIREDAINYCNQAIAIVESNNLTISRFNAITVEHQSDPALLDRIQAALQRLQ